MSLLSEAQPSKCMRIDTVADATPEAKLSLLLDFNDDGQADYEYAIPAGHWKLSSVELTPPVDYRSVRYILQKEGSGRAVLARLSVWPSFGCKRSSDPLEDGALCTVDQSCRSGLCASGPLQAFAANQVGWMESVKWEPWPARTDLAVTRSSSAKAACAPAAFVSPAPAMARAQRWPTVSATTSAKVEPAFRASRSRQ